MHRAPARKLPLALFVGAYMLAAGWRAAATGNTEFVFYIAVMCILIGAVLAIDRRVHFSAPVLWLLAIWGALHMAGGNLHVAPRFVSAGASPVLYNLWIAPGLLKFDQFVHFLGFFSATLACAECLRAAIGPRPLSFGLAVGVALMGVGLGAINEVVEFAAVLLMPETNVGGYVNTGWDLVANTVGAALAAAVAAVRARR